MYLLHPLMFPRRSTLQHVLGPHRRLRRISLVR